MIAEPPLDAGGAKATKAVVLPVLVAELIEGASGTVAGVTETALEPTESPALLTAFRVIE